MKKLILIVVLVAAGTFFFTKRCSDPVVKIETVTETKYVEKTDTIHTTTIKKVPFDRYVEIVRNVKGKDSIVYREKPTENTIKVNEFDAKVETDSSKAFLKILSTGEVLDVKGVIVYDQKETLTEITKWRDRSGLFLVGQSDLQLEEIGIGLDYVIKNKVMIGAGFNYNRIIENPSFKVKVGIKLW